MYDSEWIPGRKFPVFVAYNLFTLHADFVSYDEEGKTLKATGNVIVERTDGTTQRADSMSFRLENGLATPLQ
jgi:lipopolysaccharide assembly outer membrane protein LptD (OstA)